MRGHRDYRAELAHFAQQPEKLPRGSAERFLFRVDDNPDGTYLTKTYDRGWTTTKNENGIDKDEYVDVFGQVKEVKEHNGAQIYTTNYAYDAAGSLLTVTNALGHQTAMTYDLVGRKTVMQDPNMGTWNYEYFRSGDLKKQTDGRGIALDFEGRVTQTTRIIDGSTYTISQNYDALGRITLETFQDGDTFCYNYNNAGWLQSVGTWVNPTCVPSGGYVENITYNARGQKLSLLYTNGLSTSWAYDPNNFRLQTRQTLAGGTHTTVALARWAKSWTTQETLPPPSGFVNLYAGGICVGDGAGACVGGDATMEAIGGSVLGYIKSASGAGTVPVYQSTRYVSAGGSSIGWGLSLTADGPLAGYLSTTAPDSQSALAPFVQSNGLLLQGISGTPSAYLWSVQTGTVNHTDHYYLTTGQPPSGYTSEGTTAYIDGASSAGTVALARYTNSTTGYNYYSTVNDPPSGFGGGTTVGYLHATGGAGLIELYRHYNVTTGDYLITTSSAPPGGYVMQALLGYGHSSGVVSTQQNLAYTYDPVGNLKTITDAVWTASRSFNYDDLNRLTQATGNFGVNQALVTHDYTYDAIGNILSKAGVTYCYGYMAGCTDSNRLSGVKTTSDGANYSYDANGNITSGAGRTYVWNSDNRLDQVTGPGGSAVMTYDYTGIRIKKTGSSGTSYFPFTGYEIQGGTVTKYVRIGNEIIVSKQGATKRFYHNDHLGGVNIISDWNGNQVQLTEYDPWGKISLSVNVVDLTHRFTGQELDSESDVYYYGGRYYSQGLGRFISPDPFVQDPDDPQNFNRFSYVINGPQNYIDPSGFEFGGFELSIVKYSSGSSFDSYISGLTADARAMSSACCGTIGTSGNWLAGGQFGGSFFSTAPRGFVSGDPGPQTSANFNVPRVPGGGLWRGEFFIKSPTAFILGQGDDRDFSLTPNSIKSRAFFTLDFERGMGGGFFQQNPSCTRLGWPCWDALPLGKGGVSSNSFKSTTYGRELRMTGSLGNAFTRYPKIDFDIRFIVDMNMIVVKGSRDSFPSFQMTRTLNGVTDYLYRRYETHEGCLIAQSCKSDDFYFAVKLR